MLPDDVAKRLKHMTLGSRAHPAGDEAAALLSRVSSTLDTLTLQNNVRYSEVAGAFVNHWLRRASSPRLSQLVCFDYALPCTGFLQDLLQLAPKLRRLVLGTGVAQYYDVASTIPEHERAFAAWAEAIDDAPADCALKRLQVVTPAQFLVQHSMSTSSLAFIRPNLYYRGPMATSQLDDLGSACRRRGIDFEASLSTCVTVLTDRSDVLSATGSKATDDRRL